MDTRERPPHPVLVALRDQPREVSYQWLVGRFVCEMIDLDYLLADAVAAILGDRDSFALKAWGESGSDLEKFANRAGQRTPDLAPIVARYTELYTERNQLVHGLYNGCTPVTGDVEYTVTRLARLRATSTEYGVSMRSFTQGELGRLIVEAQGLQQECLLLIGRHRPPHGQPAPTSAPTTNAGHPDDGTVAAGDTSKSGRGTPPAQ